MTLLNVVNLSSFYFSHYNITESSLIIKYGLYCVLKFHLKIFGTLNTLVKTAFKKWTRQKLDINHNLFNSVTVFVPQEEEAFISLLKENCPHMKVMHRTLH